MISTYSRSASTGIGSPASWMSSRYSPTASSMFLRNSAACRPGTHSRAGREPQLHTRRHFRARRITVYFMANSALTRSLGYDIPVIPQGKVSGRRVSLQPGVFHAPIARCRIGLPTAVELTAWKEQSTWASRRFSSIERRRLSYIVIQSWCLAPTGVAASPARTSLLNAPTSSPNNFSNS